MTGNSAKGTEMLLFSQKKHAILARGRLNSGTTYKSSYAFPLHQHCKLKNIHEGAFETENLFDLYNLTCVLDKNIDSTKLGVFSATK